MRENRTSGSVRGVPGNGRSYRERRALIITPAKTKRNRAEFDKNRCKTNDLL